MAYCDFCMRYETFSEELRVLIEMEIMFSPSFTNISQLYVRIKGYTGTMC